MSILGHFFNFSPTIAIFAMAMLLSGLIAVVLGVLRPAAIVGPSRLDEERLTIPVAVALAMGFLAMVIVAASYSSYKSLGVPPAKGSPPTAPNIVDSAFLFSVPSLACVAVLLFADVFMGGVQLLRKLGVTTTRFHVGVAVGLIAALIIIPPTYAVSIVIEFIYRHVQFQHPSEHELLTYLGQEPVHKTARVVLMLSATLIAPLSEEYLFRGHLQTLIRRMLVVITSPRKSRSVVGFPVIMPSIAPDVNLMTPLPFPSTSTIVPQRPAVWQTWAAVVITSCLFAAMHERWMWPPIFFLSLGLGYIYERTGNLWSSVTVHCLFNSISTFIYLNQAHA